MPHAHGAGGETVPVITIAYPLQTSLDCPHCSLQFPGEKLEDLRKHLQDCHPDDQHDLLFLCAFCAEGMNEEEDAIQHMLREHVDTLRGLPRTGILQASDRLTTLTESGPSPMPPPGGTQDEEEVPPLPPPIYPPLLPDEPTKTPPPLPTGTPPPISPDAPREKTTNVKKGKKQEAANKKEEEAKRALAELRDRCANSLKPFVDKDLSEEEWHGFCELVEKLPEELKEITSKFGQRRGDPTRNWRRRQQRKARKEGGNNNNKTGGNEKKGKGDNKPKGDRKKDNNKRKTNDNGRRDERRKDDRRPRENNQRRRDDNSRRRDDRRPRENNRENRRDGNSREKTSHRMTGRQHKSLQVKELQMSYRRGAKRCIEKPLGDTQERRQCGIPLSTIHEQMSKCYSRGARGSNKPAWIDDPGREKTDVLEAPFAADEVRRQLRRLPAYSAPGPDGVTYANWKRLDPEGELLSIILNICRKVARIPLSWKTSTTVLAYKNKGTRRT